MSNPTVPTHNRPTAATHGARIERRRLADPRDIQDVETSYTPEALRAGSTFYDAIKAAAEEHPDKAAIVHIEPPDFFSPVRTVDYRLLVSMIERSASLFHDSAGGAPSIVGLMLPMVPEGLAAIWGAATSGIAVPLNPFLELNSLIRILNDAACTTLVTTRKAMGEKCGGDEGVLRTTVPSLRTIFYIDGDPRSEQDLATAMDGYIDRGLTFERNLDPYRDAVYMPTGGTTGTPKLVRMSQFGQLTVTWNVGGLMGPRPDGVVAHGMPNFHCGGSVSLGLRTILYGQTLVTLTSEGFRNRDVVSEFWEIARHYGVTSLLATPTTAQALLSRPGGENHTIEDFHIGGSTLPTALAHRFHARFGVWLRENWGMTEVHGTVTGHPNDGTEPRIGSAGTPLPYCRVAAVELHDDGTLHRICDPGERGLLVIGGPMVSMGYLNSELNREFFVSGMPDGQVWANTGDIGTVDEDGYVWVSGRAKDLIIRGGHNIDPGEIEYALCRHPGVHLAAAVGRPDAGKGELPVAFVQLEEGASATSDELLAFCRHHVQERAATPVEIVILDQLPLTPVGKLAKPALRALATEREVQARVDMIFEDGVAYGVHIDNSGRRPLVVVELEHDRTEEFDDQVHELRRLLAGYEFDSDIRLRRPPCDPSRS
ncbi:AMP-binding protein [Gordonia sp. NPDC003376]